MASRDATPEAIGVAIGWACANSLSLDCSQIPEDCESNVYRVGDYVFNHYYTRHGNTSNPLLGCSFGGAGIFAPRKLYATWTGASRCAGDRTSTITSSTSTGLSSQTFTTTSSPMVHSSSTLTTFMIDSNHDLPISTTTSRAPTSSSFLGASRQVTVPAWILSVGLLAVSTTALHM